MHPLTEPIPPMSEQEEEYDKPYYANGTVPSWMGYRPLPVPTYEDIMFTQVEWPSVSSFNWRTVDTA